MNRRAVLQLLAAGAAWPASRWLTADLAAMGAEIHATLAVQDAAFRAFDARTAALVTAAAMIAFGSIVTCGTRIAAIARQLEARPDP